MSGASLSHNRVGSPSTSVWLSPPSLGGFSPPLCGYFSTIFVWVFSIHSYCGHFTNFLKIPKFYPKKLSYISTIYHPMSFSISLAGLEFNLELNHRIQLGSGSPSDQPIFRFPALSLFSRRLSQVFFGEWVFLIWMGIDLLLIGYMVAFL